MGLTGLTPSDFAHPVFSAVTFVKFRYLGSWRMGVVLPSWLFKVSECGTANDGMGFDRRGGGNTTRPAKETARKESPSKQNSWNLSSLYFSSG